MKTTKQTITEPFLMVSSHHGIYVPQIFIQNSTDKILKQIPDETKQTLLEGPDNEDYWYAFDELYNITFKHNSQRLFLESVDGNLWFVPLCYTRTKEYKENWCI